VQDFLTPIGRFLARDRLSTFLLFSSLALVVLFFSLLG
jgi:hypothetical protein